MLRGKRLKQKQLAMYKRQPLRPGRPAGRKNRNRPPSLSKVRCAVYELIRLGHTPKAAVRQVVEWYGKDELRKAIAAYSDGILSLYAPELSVSKT
jgi:hypothetical protein